MSERRIETYEEFWKFYVREHSNRTNRRLHFIGSTGALACALAAIVKRNPKYLLAAAVAGYGGAWIGHFGFEGNRPATFKYPLWSFVSDIRMWSHMVRGRLWSGDPLEELGLEYRDEGEATESRPTNGAGVHA